MSKRICSLSALISLFCLNLYATETTAATEAVNVAIIWAIGIIVSFMISTTVLLLIIISYIGKWRIENNSSPEKFVKELISFHAFVDNEKSSAYLAGYDKGKKDG